MRALPEIKSTGDDEFKFAIVQRLARIEENTKVLEDIRNKGDKAYTMGLENKEDILELKTQQKLLTDAVNIINSKAGPQGIKLNLIVTSLSIGFSVLVMGILVPITVWIIEKYF